MDLADSMSQRSFAGEEDTASRAGDFATKGKRLLTRVSVPERVSLTHISFLYF